MLIIEVDGITHQSKEVYKRDQLRDKNLNEVGSTMLPFSSWEVLNRINDVSTIIIEWVRAKENSTP